MEKVNELKVRGNNALSANNHKEAIDAYTEAIELDAKNHVLYSNRSVAYTIAGKLDMALRDAEKTIELNPKWPKGYSRKGAALVSLQRYNDALKAYSEGLEHDPTNAVLLQGQKEVLRKMMGDVPMDTVSPEEMAKLEAKLAKDAGNEAYKKKDFENALLNYNKAVELDKNDITFYNNIAAVYFEQKEYEKCIKECERAIEIGRENRADFKLIAKAFSRIGNAYRKMEDWKSAKIFYEKAMSEHRTPEIKTILSDIEKRIKEDARKAYIDPVKSAEEKEKGNELFKKGDYSAAIKHYSEAIKRNPDDSKLYSNRAACYTKLAAFDLGLKDCEKCIELDNTFIKGYIRKGKILQGMQKQSKALAAYQKALELDPKNAEAVEGYRACSMVMHCDPQEVFKNALSDPEVQQILNDPAMRLILEQMQNDPNAIKDHLKNPAIADKIMKLLECGIIHIQ